MRDDIVNPQLESSRTCRTMEQRERNGRPSLFHELRFQFTLCLFNTILIKAYPAGLRMRAPHTLVCQNSFIQRRVGANSARGTKEIGKARRVFGSYDRRRSVWRPLRLFSSPLAWISVTWAERIRETFFHPPGRGESLRESHGDRGRASVAPGISELRVRKRVEREGGARGRPPRSCIRAKAFRKSRRGSGAISDLELSWSLAWRARSFAELTSLSWCVHFFSPTNGDALLLPADFRRSFRRRAGHSRPCSLRFRFSHQLNWY